MKAIVVGLAVLSLAATCLAQTPVPASSKQPQPGHSSARAATPKPAAVSFDAMLASINAKLEASYPAYVGSWEASLSYQNGNLAGSANWKSSNGWTQQDSFASDLSRFGDARYFKTPDNKFRVVLSCRWRQSCVRHETSGIISPIKGQLSDTAAHDETSWMLSVDSESNAASITKALNELFRSTDGRAQKPAPPAPGVVEDTRNTLYANIYRNFTDTNSEDRKNVSNVTLRFEAGKLILESDEAHPNAAAPQHVMQVADVNDLDSITYEWREGLGFLLNVGCKSNAQCNQAFYVNVGGSYLTARAYDKIGPIVVPAQNQDDHQKAERAYHALDAFLGMAATERPDRPAAAPETFAASVNATMMKEVPLNANVSMTNTLCSVRDGKLILEWDVKSSAPAGGIRHVVDEANVNSLTVPIAIWSSDAQGSFYKVFFWCKAGTRCVEEGGANPVGENLGPFALSAEGPNSETARPLVEALENLLDAAKAPQQGSTPPSPETVVSYINSLHALQERNEPSTVASVALHAKNGKITLEDDRAASNGFAAHEEWIADARDLDKVGVVGPFADSGYVVNIYCKTNDPCVTRPQKVTGLPENVVVGLAPQKFNYLGGIVARDQDTAQGIAKQLETLLKAASDTSAADATKKQSAEPSDSSGPSVDETLAYISSQLVPTYSNQGANFTNLTFKYEGGRVIFEEDAAWPAQGVSRHFSESASVRDLDGVYYSFQKDIGVRLWLACKDGAKCVSIIPHTTAMPENSNADDAPFKGDHSDWLVVQNVEMAGRVAKALDHLIKIAAKESEQADPFK
jgi:hypothetical protein